MAQCKAKSKQSGKRCKKHAVQGFQVCHIHGGKSKVGIASPAFKTGRYSKHKNANLVARYHRMLENPRLLSLQEDIAVVDVRIQELWEQVDGEEASQAWDDIGNHYVAMRLAMREGDKEKLTDALVEMESSINFGKTMEKTWDEITKLQDRRRKLFESQSRHMERERNYVSNDVILLVMGAILDLISRHVVDSDTKARLADGIDGILKSTVISQ